MAKSEYCLYVHKNKINGKRYIGITNNLSKRWYGKGKKYENCKRFWAAIQKYGWDNFEHTVLFTGLTLEEANRLEMEYIAKYQTQDKSKGYNINPGGDFVPTMLGKKHKESTKQKMREKAIDRTITEEQKERHRAHMTGLLVGARNAKSKPVICLDTGKVYACQRAAAADTGCDQSKISLCCQGKRSHTHGLKWAYADMKEVI